MKQVTLSNNKICNIHTIFFLMWLFLIPVPHQKKKRAASFFVGFGNRRSRPELLLVVKLSQHPLQNVRFTEGG